MYFLLGEQTRILVQDVLWDSVMNSSESSYVLRVSKIEGPFIVEGFRQQLAGVAGVGLRPRQQPAGVAGVGGAAEELPGVPSIRRVAQRLPRLAAVGGAAQRLPGVPAVRGGAFQHPVPEVGHRLATRRG